jgi:hypothetical protein
MYNFFLKYLVIYVAMNFGADLQIRNKRLYIKVYVYNQLELSIVTSFAMTVLFIYFNIHSIPNTCKYFIFFTITSSLLQQTYIKLFEVTYVHFFIFLGMPIIELFICKQIYLQSFFVFFHGVTNDDFAILLMESYESENHCMFILIVCIIQSNNQTNGCYQHIHPT